MFSSRLGRVAGGLAGALVVVRASELWRISLLIASFGELCGPDCGAGSGVLRSQPKARRSRPTRPGGRSRDVGPYAIPKKKDEPPPPPPPTKPKKIEGMPDYSIHVDVPVVEVPVMVTTKDGQFISNLKTGKFPHFRRWRTADHQQLHAFRKRRSRRCCWLNSRPAITSS